MDIVKKTLEKFYTEKYQLFNIDYNNIVIPEANTNLNGIAIIPKDLKSSDVIEAMRKEGIRFWIRTGIIDQYVINDRTTEQSYLFRFNDSIEPEQDLRDLLVGDPRMKIITPMTLLERLIIGHLHFVTTGKHLDIEYCTLCAGSRTTDDKIPIVYFCPKAELLCIRFIDSDETSNEHFLPLPAQVKYTPFHNDDVLDANIFNTYCIREVIAA